MKTNTIPKALPVGVNQRAASEALTQATEDFVNAGIARQTAPRRAGPKAQATAQLPVRTSRTKTAKI